MEKLLESYKSLTLLATQVWFSIEVHHTFTEYETKLNEVKFRGIYINTPLSKTISGFFLNQSILIASSFFDEYNEEFTSFKHPSYKDRLVKLKKITKPAIKRLNQWTNFKDYRNYVLAHSYRFKEKSFFDKDLEVFTFNCPNSNSEIILLANLIRIVTTCIAQEFPELVEQMDNADNLHLKINFESNEVNIDTEVKTIWTQINTIKEQL